ILRHRRRQDCCRARLRPRHTVSRDWRREWLYRSALWRENQQAQLARQRSFVESAARPYVALNEDFPVRWHAWFGKPDSAFHLQLHAHHLLHAIVTEVRILRSASCLWMHALHLRIDCLRRL